MKSNKYSSRNANSDTGPNSDTPSRTLKKFIQKGLFHTRLDFLGSSGFVADHRIHRMFTAFFLQERDLPVDLKAAKVW